MVEEKILLKFKIDNSPLKATRMLLSTNLSEVRNMLKIDEDIIF